MESALALVHQRFSTNTFPSWPLAHPVPLRRAQRRDQHAARQHQLDARARRAAAVDAARRRSEEDPAGHPRRRQRHGDVRQRARAARRCPADRCPTPILMMIPEPWSSHETMTPRGQGVLRVPLVADGAVGRTGVDRVHRRHASIGAVLDRNGLRPSRYYVTKDDLVDHGVRGRRARHPGRRHPAQGAPASRAAVPRGHGPGPHRRRTRRLKRELAAAQPVRRVARRPSAWTSRICRRRRTCRRPATSGSCSASSCSATRRKISRSCLAPMATQGRRSRSARWAPTRRWRCCRIARGCSTTTSSSSSRRSPTRRSTPSARSW